MDSQKQLALEELTSVGHVRDQNQNQALRHQLVEAAEDKVSRRFDKDLS